MKPTGLKAKIGFDGLRIKFLIREVTETTATFIKILAQFNLHWHLYLNSQSRHHSILIFWGSSFFPQDVGL